jgi:quinone-modifying oxidoreductase, subunit QmoC
MLRKLKFQREADPDWALRISGQPGCEGIFSCLQCGTCSGTCPLSIYMDYAPRRIIALVREGFRADALQSETIWLCASCYSCAVLCPRQIHITDIMYQLKREAMRQEMYPRRFPIPVLARAFYEAVRKHGRSSEFWVVLKMALRSNPMILLGLARSGWDLLRSRRISLHVERIAHPEELRRQLEPKEAEHV